jgi:hypothetical protein
MLIVLPISSADAELAGPFLEALKACGPYNGHRLLVVARPSDGKHSIDLVNEAAKMGFDSPNLHWFDEDGPKGWPLGPNFYWSETVRHLQKENNSQPWLWMELDCTPLVPGWADKLEEEYKNCGTPFLGMYGANTAVTINDELITLSRHLVGVAIYPPQVPDYSQLWAKTPVIEKAFDVVCEWEFVPKSTESKLMQHGFRTRHYMELPGGVLQGVDTNNFPGGRRYDQPIREGVVLHHGCEDGSLAKIVARKANQNLYGLSSLIPS